jgi:hypothetical protein
MKELCQVNEIELTKTYCNYGGHRFWFICPGLFNKACGRRIGVLYKPLQVEDFACRHWLILNLSF